MDLLQRVSVRVAVDGHALTHFPAQQAVQRKAGALALDVPQGHVDAGDRVADHGSVTPVPVVLHQIPQFFNAVDVAPDQQGAQIFLDHARHGFAPVGKRGAAQPVQAGFGCDDFHDDQVFPGQICGVNGNVL